MKCDRCETEAGKNELVLLPVNVHFSDPNPNVRAENWCVACVRGENDAPGARGAASRLTLPGGVRARRPIR